MLLDLHIKDQFQWGCALCTDKEALLDSDPRPDQLGVWLWEVPGLSASSVPNGEHAAWCPIQYEAVSSAPGHALTWWRGPLTCTHTKDLAFSLQHADSPRAGNIQSSRCLAGTREKSWHFGSTAGCEECVGTAEVFAHPGGRGGLLRVYFFLGRTFRIFRKEARNAFEQAQLQWIRPKQNFSQQGENKV